MRAARPNINMPVASEAALAVETGIPYAALAMSTDYECWKTDEEAVPWDAILAVFNENAKKVTKLLIDAIAKVARLAGCGAPVSGL